MGDIWMGPLTDNFLNSRNFFQAGSYTKLHSPIQLDPVVSFTLLLHNTACAEYEYLVMLVRSVYSSDFSVSVL